MVAPRDVINIEQQIYSKIYVYEGGAFFMFHWSVDGGTKCSRKKKMNTASLCFEEQKILGAKEGSSIDKGGDQSLSYRHKEEIQESSTADKQHT